jgi:hypothetical protein
VRFAATVLNTFAGTSTFTDSGTANLLMSSAGVGAFSPSRTWYRFATVCTRLFTVFSVYPSVIHCARAFRICSAVRCARRRRPYRSVQACTSQTRLL